jgi:hypothetical protein
LPTPSGQKATAQDGLLIQRLNALDLYIKLMCETFEASRASASKPDRGGKTNMFTQRFGTPSQHLVVRSWEIYEDFKRGGASTTESGSFHSFVYYVRVYATGSSTGKRALLNAIKKWLGRDGLPKRLVGSRPDKMLT